VSLWLGLGIVLALIAINGFFVAGEFALVAVNRSRVESRAADGDRRATRLLDRLRDLSFELSGAQLGITATSLIIGAVAEDTVAQLIGPALDRIGISSTSAALIIALVLATVFQMIFGELFPKNLAIARAYPTAIRVGLPMATVNGLLRPLILFFNAAANWTVRRVGIEPRDELAGLRSLQELELIVRASSEEGELDERRSSLLTRAIGFVDRDAAEAMVPRVDVVGIEVGASVEDLRGESVRTGHSRFPVYDGDLDSIVGIAHVKDTLRVPAVNRPFTPVTEIAVAPHVVPEAIHLDSLLLDLQRARRSMAVVVDEYGGTAGIVTVEDIVEEILGEIEDEYDAAARVRGRGLHSGGLHRHELEQRTGFRWPEGNYETLSGFVTNHLERFPTIGDVVEVGEYRIEVVAVEGNVATWIRVQENDGSGE
jgi:CBS domain containing-hemolysin-like protein